MQTQTVALENISRQYLFNPISNINEQMIKNQIIYLKNLENITQTSIQSSMNILQYFVNFSMASHKINNRNTSFVQKLMGMLEDQQCHPYIQWINTANGFNITNVSGFTQQVLPIYFKHQNFSSFVRQLNMYGFTKIRGKQGDNIYEHRNFKRGSKACIKKIQRKIGSQGHEKQQQLVVHNHQSAISEIKKKQSQIQKLKIHQIDLQKKCVNLLQKNKSLLHQNEAIVQAIKLQQQKKKKLINEILKIIAMEQSQHSCNKQIKSIQKVQEEQEIDPLQIQFVKKQKILNILDPNQQHQYLSLDAFMNIDEDQLSQGFKL